MGFFRKLFGKPNNSNEQQTPKPNNSQDTFARVLTGKENECEYCHRPIFTDTESWTKQAGHYFHRKCWKTGVKNQDVRV